MADLNAEIMLNVSSSQVVAVLNPLAKEKLTGELQEEIAELQESLSQAHEEVTLPSFDQRPKKGCANGICEAPTAPLVHWESKRSS